MYPGVYVSAAVLTLQAMVGGSLRGARGHGVRLVLAGMVVQALAFIFWSEQLLDNTYMPGASFVDPLWGVSLLAIGAGGVMSSREEEELATDGEPGILGGVLPAGTFVLLVAALVHAEISEPPFAARVALLICGATLVARAALLEQRSRRLLENERIARSLLAAREADLGRLNQRLVEDSRRDPLTGLRNRRAVAEDLAGLEDGAASYTFALLDVDRFKASNDHLGHLAGDQALRSLAACVRGALRTGDSAYRYGGEELLLIVPGARLEEGVAVAERVRAAVAGAGMPHPGTRAGILTVPIGVAAGSSDPAQLLARADSALYEAKRTGRDRVVATSAATPRSPAARVASPVEDPLARPPRHLLNMGMPVTDARLELVRCAGTQFDAAVVDAFPGTLGPVPAGGTPVSASQPAA